jgi:hypothetical protein
MVQELIDQHGLSAADIAKGIGATIQEIDVLYQNNIFKARNLESYRYSEAWTVEKADKATVVEANRSGNRQRRLRRRLCVQRVGDEVI